MFNRTNEGTEKKCIKEDFLSLYKIYINQNFKICMELSNFLVKAKIETYASIGERGEKILQDGCKELEYTEGNFQYHDKYYGFNPFIGEEVVFDNGDYIWGMNYYGGVLGYQISAIEVYKFLQKAMRLVREDRPYRGPSNYTEGNFKYVDKSEGNFDNFSGIETIFFKGEEVYKLYYHGGVISK
ncbi:MAG: hypothetical protein HWN81_07090 [Candidatus Lokiarchaeota archaeon]|nr:hypothetical protein [Candidatus Lokiarchaeota archaeon]